MNQLKHIFGTDPEAFIYRNHIQDAVLGRIPYIIPPIALVKDFGAKYTNIKGKKVLIKGPDYQWSEDGAAIELQMKPTNMIETFIKRLNTAQYALLDYVKQFGLNAVTNLPVGYFDLEKYWVNRDEEFRSCVIFGCDPDQFPMLYLDLGLDKINTKEIDVSKHSYRYGGGHIHIQAPKTNPEIYFENWHIASIIFDFIAGLRNVTFRKPPIISAMEAYRLKYYGRPGRIRLQTYNAKANIHGIEYRVLPNSWANTPNYITILLKSLDAAASLVESKSAPKFIKEFETDIPKMYSSIIKSNVKIAEELLNKVATWLHNHEFIYSDDFASLVKR